MIGSHNSMSYLKVRNPLMWLPNLLVAKCQSKDILNQLHEVDFVDIRIYYHKSQIRYAHGLVSYKTKAGIESFFNLLNLINYEYPGKIVRLILERCNSDKDENEFKVLCSKCESLYASIRFTGGYLKKGWKSVYKFRYNGKFTESQWVSSMKGKCILRICPWLYNVIYGKSVKKIAEEYNNDNKINMFDFI